MAALCEVDILVGNNLMIDSDVYELWLNGYSAQEAAIHLRNLGVLKKYQATFEDLQSDTQDYYRTFSCLERLLKNPPKLLDQQIYQIDPETQRALIEKYYMIDPQVVREILGKKLSSRNRKDLDDVSEKTNVMLRSCRRQFDNIKRVFKTVEELMGSLVENIKTHYLLSEDLARQYAAIVFITNNRFETGKKKLSYLTFDDYAHCANQMISNWSYSSAECTGHEDMDVDLDRDFLRKLRDLRVLNEKESLEEHKSRVLQKLKPFVSKRAYQDTETNFKSLSKIIINIAYGLNHSKDARDIFVDLVEKIVEPYIQSRWTKPEFRIFLNVYKDTVRDMDLKIDSSIVTVWERYISTLSSCILQMFHT